MPRAPNGNYTLPSGDPYPAVPNTLIDAVAFNTMMADVQSAMTDSLSRSGLGGMLAPLPFVDGLVSGPGISFINELTSGLYRAGTGDVRMAVVGTDITRWKSGTGFQFWNGSAWVGIPFSGGVLQAADGVVGGPGFEFLAETNTGMYRAGAGDLRFAVLGTDTLRAQLTSPGTAFSLWDGSSWQVFDAAGGGINVVTGAFKVNGLQVSTYPVLTGNAGGRLTTNGATVAWTVGPNYHVSSTSSGAFTNSSGSITPITNMSVTITPTGTKPIRINVISDGANVAACIGWHADGSGSGGTSVTYTLERNGTPIAYWQIGQGTSVAAGQIFYPASLGHTDDGATANISTTYTLLITTNQATHTVGVAQYLLLEAYELG